MRKATIKEVAKEARVSIGTVSNALNNARYVNVDTKKRVMDAVEKLNYIPNLNGRYLKAGATKTLGFFTNSIAGPYFCSLIDAMSKRCESLGYTLVVYITRDPSIVMSNIIGRSMDGVLIYENSIEDEEMMQLHKEGIKAVFLDREISEKGIASVLFDSYQAGYEATTHLIDQGHKKISFIECEGQVVDSLKRKEGFRAAMEEHGLQVDEKLMIEGAFEEEHTFGVVQKLIKENPNKIPEAFLAGNDLSAIGCMKALTQEGYQVPRDISVIGFDDIDIAEYYRPSLTTVRNPIKEQGILAIETLINMIEYREEGSIKHLKGSLIIRKSCELRK